MVFGAIIISSSQERAWIVQVSSDKQKSKINGLVYVDKFISYTSTLRGYTVKHPGKRGDYKAPVVHASHASKNICVNHDSMTMNLRGEAFKANPNLGENDTEMTRFWRWFWARHLLNGAPNRHPFPDTHQKGCLMDTRSPTHLQGVEKTDTWMTRIDTHERMHISLFVYP